MRILDYIVTLLIGIGWLMGIVLAVGKASTFFAIICPCYAWYLVAERLMQLGGMI